MRKNRLLFGLVAVLLIGNAVAASNLASEESSIRKCVFRQTPFAEHCIEVCEGTLGGCGGVCEPDSGC